LSLKLGKFGAFIGCSNYPACKFTRVLSPNGQNGAGTGEGERPGVRALGIEPKSGDEITLRSGRFGDYVQQGEGDKPRRCSLPKGLAPDDVTLEKAVTLLSLPREVARHPESGEPILAGIGRYGSYVQHGKTYANLSRNDDVLAIGANRAIDLIVAKESGAGRGLGVGAGARALGDHPALGGAVTVKSGRFGPYVNHGKINATLPRGSDPASLTLEEAVAMLAAKAAGGGGGRALGDHPDGGVVTLRDGRFGAYVNWGKVNATIPKSISPEKITLDEAIALIAEREGRPARSSARGGAKAKGKAPVARARAAKTAKTKPVAAKRKAAAAKTKPAAGKAKAAAARTRPAAGRTKPAAAAKSKRAAARPKTATAKTRRKA
jgi:DNA topoisomerase-1